MKRPLALAGLLISAGCVYFFARTFANHWASISAVDWSSGVWLAMSLAIVLYISTYFPVSYAWNCSLAALGHRLPYRSAVKILAVSQIAKYLPGNVGHHIGRVVLAKREGVPSESIVGSMVLDTLIVLSAGALWSLWALQLLLRVLQQQGGALKRTALIGSAICLAGVFLATLIPPARRAMTAKMRRLAQLVHPNNLALLCSALLAHTTSFVTGGTVLFLLSRAFSHEGANLPWTDIGGIYAAAWLLGFLIPGAPAGLGIREMALLFGLGPMLGNEISTVVAASLRVITTAGDGIVFAAGLVFGKREDLANDAASGLD